MLYRGEIHNGAVVFTMPIALPEGSQVMCDVQVVETGGEVSDDTPGPFADLLEFSGIIEGTPPDYSENLDEYLYGRQ